MASDEDRLPELFVRGAGVYRAQMNAENPLGTMQSIEHALRALDKMLGGERERIARAEKMLGDYQEQAGRPFEHEAKLKDLIARQGALNALLDLDKGEKQAAPEAEVAPETLEGDAWMQREQPQRRTPKRRNGAWRKTDGQDFDGEAEAVIQPDADPPAAYRPEAGPGF
jgi:hypothetical protein